MTCEVIRDLLPLCADGVASQESRAAVEAHIHTCAACHALYESMCAPVEAQEAPKEPDYMDAVRRQKKENRRFILRVYGVAMGIALLFGAMWLVGKMLDYEGWRYESVAISYETVKKEMPETLLTKEEKALAKVIFALPEVQSYLTDVSLVSNELPEEFAMDLLVMAGKEAGSINLMWNYVEETLVSLAYTEGDRYYVLEYYDTDLTGNADLLRKMVRENSENISIKTLYYAEINAALIATGNTGDAERDALEAEYEEQFTTTYEKVSGKREWLAFLFHN